MFVGQVVNLRRIVNPLAALRRTPTGTGVPGSRYTRTMQDLYYAVADVSGGEPYIVQTRIPVWVLEQARRLGASEDELLRSYPTLRAEDLATAWAYVRSHRSDIEEQIRDNESA
jgi:uncharacterized protein (DUF433 family)